MLLRALISLRRLYFNRFNGYKRLGWSTQKKPDYFEYFLIYFLSGHCQKCSDIFLTYYAITFTVRDKEKKILEQQVFEKVLWNGS